MSRLRLLVLAACAAGGAGCGSDGFRYVPVSGRVTLNGQPVPDARVSFQPEAVKLESGRGSVGTTDAAGRFELKVIGSPALGAKVGRHVVSVSKTDIPVTTEDFDRPGARSPKEVLPARYNSATELTFEVPDGGTADANLDLKAP